MSNTSYPELKRSHQKWLLAVALMLALFTFPGFDIQNQTRLEKQETTLIVNFGTGITKSISYQRASIKSKNLQPLVPALVDISSLHNALARVRLISLPHFCASLQTGLFYQPKTISESSDDGPAIS